jgi:hypothetical protein
MRRVPQQHANSSVRRERDPRSLTRQTLLLSACVVLAVGFVFATRQKIAAVQYGYRSEELRRERERLVEEQRRLLLTIEESASLEHLERAGRDLGLQPARAAHIGSSTRKTNAAEAGAASGDKPGDLRKEDAKTKKSRSKSEAARSRR